MQREPISEVPIWEIPIWEVTVSWRGLHGEEPRAVALKAAIEEVLGRRVGEVRASDLYFLSGSRLDRSLVERAAEILLSDPVTQFCRVGLLGTNGAGCADRGSEVATVFKKTGVMDPVEGSLLVGLRDLGASEACVRTATQVHIAAGLEAGERRLLAEKVLSNPVIEEVFWNDEPLPPPFTAARPYSFVLRRVSLTALDDTALERLSRESHLSLSLREMQAIRAHFAAQGREPTDIELETLAQTWSEHCCHKTLTSAVEHRVFTAPGDGAQPRETERHSFQNLLKETIGRATEECRVREQEPFCLSVFQDNAGVVAFDSEHGVSFKVETHNHPSAIEPYGGAGTGIGGVLRDTLGTGLGAKPIANTDVFCVGPLDLPRDALPPGTLHPLRVLRGVVAGVRDYGNRMGIPTASGALFFDERYVGNPLVFCGSVGLIPRRAIEKEVCAGDRIVVLGGRTGRDGIHGATFSSVELTEASETVSSGAVQIGNAITEKKVLDVLLEARDLGLFRAVTDCGAGGLSSAAGEMGARSGARVDLDRVPVKYEGLSYAEVWISEAQERMVLAVPPERLEALTALAARHDVDATDIGEFTGDGRLRLSWRAEQVGDLDMSFLHGGRPCWVRQSTHTRREPRPAALDGAPRAGVLLKTILASANVASKEWVIRQYDHEVQGRSVLKPLQGVRSDGPGDGVAFTPVLGSWRGVVIGCGMNPCYGDLDPYRMALSAVDEAVRNVVAAGGDPARCAVLDNFSWGNTERPETLGSLVEAARGCRDAALALSTPFISGKDSLNNEFRSAWGTISVPPSLLISSLAVVDDVCRLVSMDLKAPDNLLVLIGETLAELGGSHLLRVLMQLDPRRFGDATSRGQVPGLSQQAKDIHAALHRAIEAGLVRSAHDLSEGGLAVAAAEMAFSGEVGAEIELSRVAAPDDVKDDLTLLFSESNTRYLLEVQDDDLPALLACFRGLPAAVVGRTVAHPILRVIGRDGEPHGKPHRKTVLAEALKDLKEAWQGTLRL